MVFISEFDKWKVKNLSPNLWLINDSFGFEILAEAALELIPSTQILVASWCLTAFVIVQSYNSCLVSYLTTPKYIPVANTIKDMADSFELSLVVLKYTSIEPAILVNLSGTSLTTRHQLQILIN